MSRTHKGGKAPGYEFWSRRPGTGRGAVAKAICHRKERGQAKGAVRSGLGDAWLPGGPYPAGDQDAFDEREAEKVDQLYAALT